MRGSRSTEALDASHEHLLVRQFSLRALSGPAEGMVYRAKSDRVVLGTHKSAHWFLDDPTMSRFHCEITLSGGKARIRDLGSRNGTRVDGVSIEAAPLGDGQVLTLGRTQIRFELGRKEIPIALSPRERFGFLHGRATPMRALFALLEHAARTISMVLLSGETGTGKDLAAESIHLESTRKEGPFIVVDCGAASPRLLEDQLFGHERGAFTGADRARPGAFEAAHGGTLLLSEIGELSAELQPKLLRALDARKIQRIGSNRPNEVDVRIVATTSRNLRRMVNERDFRSDLYYRLAVFDVTLPPLRERLDDLPLLVPALLEQMGAKEGRTAEALHSETFLAELRRHLWPGNVRELRNHLERCLSLQSPSAVQPAEPRLGAFPIDSAAPFRMARAKILETFERRYLEELLRKHGNNVREAAPAAGLGRAYLYRLLARHGLG